MKPQHQSLVLVVALLVLAVAAAPVQPPLPSGLGACDPLVPQYCAFPWPNNFFAINNSSSVTGLQLNVQITATPKDRLGTTTATNQPTNPTKHSVDQLVGQSSNELMG
jgi:hypothetical protein